MLRNESSSYGVLVLAIFFLLFLPQAFTNKLREKTTASLAPIHQSIRFISAGFSAKSPAEQKGIRIKEKEFQELKLQNALLKEQLESVKEYLLAEERIEKQVKRYEDLTNMREQDSDFFKRREQEYLDRLSMQMCQVPAKVVYRDPAFWSSAFWINVGEKHNRKLGEKIIEIDSPVVVGETIVGVVDYVGETKSKVCLITNAALTTSVRVVRGSQQSKLLLDDLSVLIDKLSFKSDLFFSKEEQENTLHILEDLKGNIKESVHDRYLAKGEIKGSSQPLWRSRKQVLSGIGFNYDFDDVEGGARDLRTGEEIHGKQKDILLLEGDLLVTTGMDGIFPAGFLAAVVTKVDPLEEGSISYQIEAKAVCGDLSEIQNVYVLKKMKD